MTDSFEIHHPGDDIGLDHETQDRLAREAGLSEQMPDGLKLCIVEKRAARIKGAFRMGRWPVTNHQYRYYLENVSTKSPLPPGFRRDRGVVRLTGLLPSAPVVNVTWTEAQQYCRWAEGRLPTADEWEVTARGVDNTAFPWGDAFDPQHCGPFGNSDTGRPVSVFSQPSGASSHGPEDMCGNALEWTSTRAVKGGRVITMGGSFACHQVVALPSFRCPRDPGTRYPDVGFRCAFPI